eukprot:INCI13421.7.p1 GENE.INCI13421.7~~INCI13421.7.p1  ORF type:complete len:566 (+),score=54.76 INCI13421.7:240-1937(+)
MQSRQPAKLFCTLAQSLLLASNWIAGLSSPTPYDCPGCVDTIVGPAVRVGGPTCCLYDSPFVTIRVGDVLRGYSANQQSYLIAEVHGPDSTLNGSPNSSVFLSEPLETGLGRSSNDTDLDFCGSWLNGVLYEPETHITRGFYHEEWKCNYANHSFTNKSIAYAESRDDGLTFAKVGHPHNQIILPAPDNTTATHQTGEGDHGVARINDTYWLYFTEWDVPPGPLGMGVAVSTVSCGGKPLCWNKLLNRSFDSPGVGGNSDNLVNLTGTAVIAAEYRTVASSVRSNTPGTTLFAAVGSRREPFALKPRLSFSRNGIEWAGVPVPLLHTDSSNWTRDASSDDLIGYETIVAPDGGQLLQLYGSAPSSQEGTFLLFYTYLDPGATFQDRYLVMRNVTLRMDSSVEPAAFKARVALSLYRCDLPVSDSGMHGGTNTTKADWWATTAAMTLQPCQASDVTAPVVVTILTSDPTPDGVVGRPLVDCFFEAIGDHMVAVSHDECVGGGGRVLRTLGWVLADAGASNDTPRNTTALYRCYDNTTRNHAVSTSETCLNGSLGAPEFVLGYGFVE